MTPVVLIERTVAGDAFHYKRYPALRRGGQPVTSHEIVTAAADVGKQLPALSPADVELFRVYPDKL